MKPFTEKPLPTNIPQPPKGWYFIGFDEDLPRSDCKELMAVFYMIATDSWTRSDWLNRKPSRNFAIAAPEHLVNRLPAPAKPAKFRVHVESKGAPVYWHDSAESAFAEAERLANRSDVIGDVYVYELRDKVTAEKVIKKEEY